MRLDKYVIFKEYFENYNLHYIATRSFSFQMLLFITEVDAIGFIEWFCVSLWWAHNWKLLLKVRIS